MRWALGRVCGPADLDHHNTCTEAALVDGLQATPLLLVDGLQPIDGCSHGSRIETTLLNARTRERTYTVAHFHACVCTCTPTRVFMHVRTHTAPNWNEGKQTEEEEAGGWLGWHSTIE